jgi:hypothetical protein
VKRDAEPDLDWTFSAIPADQPGAPLEPPPAPPPRAARPSLRALPRWLGPLALMVAALLGGTAFIYTQRGWRAVENQVAREVLYEDQQARAGAADLVLALQAEDGFWRALRGAETLLRWPAPQPAPNLLPLPGPPQRVGPLRALGDNVFEIPVTRRYADGAGQVGVFEHVQRYRSLGPGLWERLPPDTAALVLLDTWTAPRLHAVYPHAEAAWLPGILLRVEAILEQACRDWECPPELIVSLEFSSALQTLMPAAAPARAVAAFPEAYPILFDLPVELPRYPPRVVWPAPSLAGIPRDEAAASLLVRSLAVAGLANLAEQLSGQARQSGGFFFDALVARAEVRLGLSAPPTYTVSAEEYVPIESLWYFFGRGDGLDPSQALPFRRQALAFVEAALAGQPVTAEAQLLRSLHQSHSLPGLVPWLEAVIGPSAPFLVDQRAARFAVAPQEVSSFAWSQLDGLRFACSQGVSLLRRGRLVPLPFNQPAFGFSGLHVSPNARLVAGVTISQDAPSFQAMPRVLIYDLQAQTLHTVAEGGSYTLLGWSADEALLYWQHPAADAPPGSASVLMRYSPAGGRASAVHGLDLVHSATWNHDRTGLYLTTQEPREAAPLEIGWLPFGGRPPNRLPVEILIPSGRDPLLTPDGRTLAYVSLGAPASVSQFHPPRAIMLFDLGQRAPHPLLSLEALVLETAAGPVEPLDVSLAAWSPDSQRLAFHVAYPGSRRLFTIRNDGSDLKEEAVVEGEMPWIYVVGFSADNRFLAYNAIVTPAANFTTFPLKVVDLQTRSVNELGAPPGAAVWSPAGHLLAVADSDGALLHDPATGRQRWVTFGSCSGVAW